MRIAHVLVGAGWGGAERLATAVAARLSARGHEVALDATPDCRSAAGEERLPWLAGQGSSASLRGRPDRWFAWALSARQRVRGMDPHVVHMHLSTPAFASAAAFVAAGAPAVFTFHLLPERSWPLDAMTRLPSKWSLDFIGKTPPALLVAVSETDKAALHTRFPARSVRCVVNAPPPGAPEAEPITPTAWGDAEHRLLFVGRLEVQKGVDRLLRALASPALERTPFRLLVIGDGPARGELEALASSLGLRGRVVFTGGRPALSAMPSAHVVVCPSRYEGMPLVPMEAILCGAAVVASPIAAHRELLSGMPECLLPPDDRGWARWWLDFLSDPAKRRNLCNRQASRRPRFSLDRVVDEYAALYEEVADAEPPAGAGSRTGSFSLRQLTQNARVACLNPSSVARARP